MTTPSGPRRAVLYGRVSKLARRRNTTDPSTRDEGASIDQQLAAMTAQALREGVEILGPYRDDGISASRFGNGKAREGWAQTMEEIVSGRANEMWAWEISRATRDRPVWATLINACMAQHVLINVNGRLHDPLDPDDGFMLDLQAALAVRESAVTSKRIRRDVLARATEGKPHGKIPYGYTREYDPKTRALLRQVPDPETAPILRELVRRVLGGESMHAIAGDLNRRGVPSPELVRTMRVHGEADPAEFYWRGDEIRDQLLSPTAAGQRVHKGLVVADATWPAIISHSERAALLAILQTPGRQHWFGPVKHLLSGIAECGVCGTPLRRLKNRGYDSYACPGRERRGTSCVTRIQKPLDAMVTLYVTRRLLDPQLLERAARARAGDEARTASASVELTELQAKMAVYEDSAKRATGAGAATFARLINDTSEQIDAVQARLSSSSGLPRLVLDAAGPDADAKWERKAKAGDLVWQRQVIRALVRVVVHRSNQRRGVRGFDESSVEIIDL